MAPNPYKDRPRSASAHHIPANDEPAFWDTLPDLSRYPPPSQVLPTAPNQLVHPQNLPSSSSLRATSPTCPQPATGSIHELREHRRTSSLELHGKLHSRNSSVRSIIYHANSDLKSLYAQNDRAQLLSQEAKNGHSFEEERKLSRSGALRRRKSRIFHTPAESEPNLESGKRVVHFSPQASYAPSLRDRSDSESSMELGEVLDIDELLGVEESKDDLVENALQEAAANAQLYRRDRGEFLQGGGSDGGFRGPEREEGMVGHEAGAAPTPIKKHAGKRSSSSVSGIVRAVLGREN